MNSCEMENKKRELKNIFADPDRFEDGMRQLMDWIGVNSIQNECILLSRRKKSLDSQERKRTITSEEYRRESNRIIDSVLTFIDTLGPENVSKGEIFKLLILVDGPDRRPKFEHYFKFRYKLPNVEISIEEQSKFFEPVDYQFLMFDGESLPHSSDKSPLTDDQQEQIDLLLAYVDPTNYEHVPPIPVIFFGPNRNELYKYPHRFIASNSWISLYSRTREMVEYLSQLRLKG